MSDTQEADAIKQAADQEAARQAAAQAKMVADQAAGRLAAAQQQAAASNVPHPDAAKHQPPPGGTVREFADHMDRAQQAVKDWVRRELGLMAQGKSHDERVKENP